MTKSLKQKKFRSAQSNYLLKVSQKGVPVFGAPFSLQPILKDVLNLSTELLSSDRYFHRLHFRSMTDVVILTGDVAVIVDP